MTHYFFFIIIFFSFFLYTDTAHGSPYKSSNRYFISETPGYNREGAFVLLKQARLLPVVISPPPLPSKQFLHAAAGAGNNKNKQSSQPQLQRQSSNNSMGSPTKALTPQQIESIKSQYSPLLRTTFRAKIAVSSVGHATATVPAVSVLILVNALTKPPVNTSSANNSVVAANITAAGGHFWLKGLPLPVKLTRYVALLLSHSFTCSAAFLIIY